MMQSGSMLMKNWSLTNGTRQNIHLMNLQIKKYRLNLGGNHHFRVEHLELGGFATLSLKLTPVE